MSHSSSRTRLLATVVAMTGLACISGTAAQAATTTATMPVSVSIPTSCTAASGTAMNFGTLASSLSVVQTDASGTITVNCTAGGAYTVFSDAGANASGAQKRMQKAATGNYLTYAIFSDTGRTAAFPTTLAGAVAGSGTGAAQTITIYGRLAAQTATAAGDYADSITFTVTY